MRQKDEVNARLKWVLNRGTLQSSKESRYYSSLKLKRKIRKVLLIKKGVTLCLANVADFTSPVTRKYICHNHDLLFRCHYRLINTSNKRNNLSLIGIDKPRKKERAYMLVKSFQRSKKRCVGEATLLGQLCATEMIKNKHDVKIFMTIQHVCS